MAILVIWFLIFRNQGLVPCTAPSAHQLQDVLWKEIARWLVRLKPPFSKLLEMTTDRVRYKDHGKGANLAEAIARTARKESPDALQGFHAADIMYLVDEASGVPESIFQTAEGALLTPGAISILTGNPTKVTGTFYRSHHEDREDWICLHWDSSKSPLVDPKYPEKMARKYGAGSFVYGVRVLGEFPLGNPDSLISLALVQMAIDTALDKDVWQRDPVVFGVDPARFGDDETGFCVRQGRKVHLIEGWGGLDVMQVAGRVVFMARQWKPVTIFVDSIGIGSGVADALRKMLDCQIVDVNVSERPADVEEYMNQRSELWWRMREWFETRAVDMVDDDILAGELCSVEWGITDKGKIRVETKKERKKRIGAADGGSPDRADALMMTFTHPEVSQMNFQQASKLMPEWAPDFA